MRITIDTNVIASAIFFGGRPRQLLEELFAKNIEAVASPEILVEYQETFNELRSRYPDKPVRFPLAQVAAFFKLVLPCPIYQLCKSASLPKVISNNSAAISLLQTRIRLSSASSFDSRFILPYQTISLSITA